jgi:hypothetical protein
MKTMRRGGDFLRLRGKRFCPVSVFATGFLAAWEITKSGFFFYNKKTTPVKERPFNIAFLFCSERIERPTGTRGVPLRRHRAFGAMSNRVG